MDSPAAATPEKHTLHCFPATLADIPTIRELAQETWPAAYGHILAEGQMDYMLEMMYSDSALREQMTIKANLFLVAYKNQQPVGFASYEHHFKNGNSTRLHKLYVLPGQQAKGAGSTLMGHVIRAASDSGDSTVELNVNKHNKAIDFYRRHGFSIAREEVIDIGRGYVMDDYVMERKL